MTTVALIHGASSNAGYWSRVIPTLEEAALHCVAPDLPAGADEADFTTYADTVTNALGGTPADVVVAQSMGAFTAPVVAERSRSQLIVLVAPMIPAPGESPGQWGENVGLDQAQADYAAAQGFDPQFDVMTTFMHDVPAGTLHELMAAGEPEQSPTIFGRPFPLNAWPAIPTRVVACTNDRLFPLPLTQRLAKERLQTEAVELESGHLPGFAHPDELARVLLHEIGG